MTDKTVHIRPRYYSLFAPDGREHAEANYRHRHLDWHVPLGEMALVAMDVWDWHFSRECLERIERAMAEAVAPAVEAARRAGLAVIHAPGPDLAARSDHWVRLLDEGHKPQPPHPDSPDWPPAEFRQKTGRWARCARPVEPDQQSRQRRYEARTFHPLVRPIADEPVIATGEELHRLCAGRGIVHLLYVGFNTNVCVLRRDYGVWAMQDRGYSVILLRDCTTGMETHETLADLACTRGVIATIEQLGAYTMTSRQLIDALGACGSGAFLAGPQGQCRSGRSA